MLNVLILTKKVLTRLLEYTVMLLMGALVLDVLWGVISRMSGSLVAWLATRNIEAWGFLPRGQGKWTEELAIYLLVWVSLLGASVAYAAKAHLGVDYFVSKLDEKAARLMEILVHLLSAFFITAVFILGGSTLVWQTLQAGQVTPALGIKVGYFYMALPISGAFILIFAAEAIVEVISGKRSVYSGTKEQ